MTQDSESYVNLADSLAQQHTYSLPYVEANALSLQYRGESHTPPPWPPGYPAVTALLVLTTGLPTAAAARWVALAAALVCVLLVYRLCRALGCSPWLAAIGAACFAVAPGTAMVVPSVWSETLFLVPVLLALICLAKAREIGWRQALLIGLLAAAAGLVRYVAVGLILAIAICILMRARREPILKKLWLLALSAGLPTAAMAGWFIRNRLVTGSFTGHQIPPCDSFAVNLSQALRALVPLFAGQHNGKEALIGVLALSALALAVMWAVQRRRATPEPSYTAGLRCALIFIAGYLLWVSVARTMTGVSPIQVRYAWPVLPMMIGVGLALLQRLLTASPRPAVPAAVAALALLAVVGCGCLTLRDGYQIEKRQALEGAQQRAAMVQSPELQALIRGKTILFVETWPQTMRALATTASRVWYMSPYVYSICDFAHPGPWRDWFEGIDAVLALAPLPLGNGQWVERRVGPTAIIYTRSQ